MRGKAFLKQYLPLLLLLLVSFAVLLYGRRSVGSEYGYCIYGSYGNTCTEVLRNDLSHEAVFEAPQDMKISGVMIDLISDHYTEDPGEVLVRVENRTKGMTLMSRSLKMSDILVFGWQEMDFDPADLSAGDMISVSVMSESFGEENTIAIGKTSDYFTPALKIKTDIQDIVQKVQMVFSLLLLLWIVFAYLFLFRFKKNPLWIWLMGIAVFLGSLMFLIPDHELYVSFYQAVRISGPGVITASLVWEAFSRVPMVLWVMTGIDVMILICSWIPCLMIEDRTLLRKQTTMAFAFLLVPVVTSLFVGMQ